MKRWMTVLVTAVFAAGSMPAQSLYEGFADPPQEARPRVWWHWMDGNVSMEGIQKDIDWMDRVGIGGFHQFDAGGIGMSKIVEPHRRSMALAAIGDAGCLIIAQEHIDYLHSCLLSKRRKTRNRFPRSFTRKLSASDRNAISVPELLSVFDRLIVSRSSSCSRSRRCTRCTRTGIPPSQAPRHRRS